MKEFFVTYQHTNGAIIRKQVHEGDLDEFYKSKFVDEVLAKTLIDFDNYTECRAKHTEAVRKLLLREVESSVQGSSILRSLRGF